MKIFPKEICCYVQHTIPVECFSYPFMCSVCCDVTLSMGKVLPYIYTRFSEFFYSLVNVIIYLIFANAIPIFQPPFSPVFTIKIHPILVIIS